MSNTEAPFSVSFKAGEGYGDPTLTVRADTAADLESRLDAVTDDVLQKIGDVRSLFTAAAAVAPLTSVPDAPDATVTPINNGGGLKTCAHGVRTKKEGDNSRGHWVGYYCPRPRNASDRCEPIYE